MGSKDKQAPIIGKITLSLQLFYLNHIFININNKSYCFDIHGSNHFYVITNMQLFLYSNYAPTSTPTTITYTIQKESCGMFNITNEAFAGTPSTQWMRDESLIFSFRCVQTKVRL